MARILTEAAQVVCSHRGTVLVVAGRRTLTVDQAAVLVEGDLDGRPVTGCSQPASGGTAPCTVTVGTLTGTARNLRVGGSPVLLDTATGTTNSVPPGTWTVRDAGQNKLHAS